MKFKSFLIALLLGAFVFTACDDNKKKEQEDQAEMERMEAEREDELREEEERMEREANSIAARAMENESLSTLVSALQNADLAATLTEEEGPYTVFAPTNDAFEKVDKATLDTLMAENHKEDLAEVLKYHVVADEITAEDLAERIENGDGEYKFKTLDGDELTALMSGENIILKDEN